MKANVKGIGAAIAVVALVVIAVVNVIGALPEEEKIREVRVVEDPVGSVEGCEAAESFLAEQTEEASQRHASLRDPVTVTGTTDCRNFRSRPNDYGTVDYLVSVRCEGNRCDRSDIFAESRFLECIVNVDPGLGLVSYRAADCL